MGGRLGKVGVCSMIHNALDGVIVADHVKLAFVRT